MIAGLLYRFRRLGHGPWFPEDAVSSFEVNDAFLPFSTFFSGEIMMTNIS